MNYKKPTIIGFLIGFFGTFAVTFTALILPIDRFADIFLFFPRLVLSPLNNAMASWSGLINMLLGAAVNGIVFLIIFSLIAKIFSNKMRG